MRQGETPVFEEMVVERKQIDAPKINTPLWQTMVHIFFFNGMQFVATYLFASYFPTYSQKYLGLSQSQAMRETQPVQAVKEPLPPKRPS